MDVSIKHSMLWILCRYASEDVCSLRVQDPNSQPSFFVIYDMANARILRVFESASDDLLTLYENFCDFLRYPASTSDSETMSCFASSPSTNVHARQAHERFVYNTMKCNTVCSFIIQLLLCQTSDHEVAGSLPAGTLLGNYPGEIVHTQYTYASVTKQYNLVPA